MTWSVRVLDPRTDPEPAGWAAFLEAQQAPLTWDYGLLRTCNQRYEQQSV